MELAGSPRIAEGSVHGRFQPLHNAHLEYILEAKRRSEFLWIGITQYDTTSGHLNPLGRHRERPEANPLTFFERIQLIRSALHDAGIDAREFAFLPFPIEKPAALPDFLPTTVTCFTTVCEAWNEEKIKVLRAKGYPVVVLWEENPKVIRGTDIREWIVAGDERWKALVPLATARAVEVLGLEARLRSLFGGKQQ